MMNQIRRYIEIEVLFIDFQLINFYKIYVIICNITFLLSFILRILERLPIYIVITENVDVKYVSIKYYLFNQNIIKLRGNLTNFFVITKISIHDCLLYFVIKFIITEF